MNLFSSIGESLRAIQENKLRTVLTAMIIAIGITALVGILTAIDGIQASVDDSFASLGVNSFTIQDKESQGNNNQQGRKEKSFSPIKYSEITDFQHRFRFPSQISVNTRLTGSAEVKYLTKKTNPSMEVYGVDDNYLTTEDYEIASGRNFTSFDLEKGTNVAVIGAKVVEALFAANENPLNKEISLYGGSFKVVGVMKAMGSAAGNSSADQKVLLPLEKARQLATNNTLQYTTNVLVSDVANIESAMGEATSLMRAVRQDPIGGELSFDITQKKSLSEQLGEVTGYLRMGGFAIGFITLLGASVALMNIMMVSVTERTREIGVRKALGATPQRIRQQFLLEAIVICQLGGLAGVLLGTGIGNVVARFMNVDHFVVPWMWMFIALIICIVVGIFSGYYPAYKASRLDPIESLRFE